MSSPAATTTTVAAEPATAERVPVGVPVKRSDMSPRDLLTHDRGAVDRVMAEESKRYSGDKTNYFPETNFDQIISDKEREVQLAVSGGDIEKAIVLLEEIREARLGVSIENRTPEVDGSTPVRVRYVGDIAEEDQKKGTESFRMQMLNAYRGAREAIDISDKTLQEKQDAKLLLLDATKSAFAEFLQRKEEFGLDDKGNIKEKGEQDAREGLMLSVVDKFVSQHLTPIVEKALDVTFGQAYAQISVSKDFLGYDLEQRNIVTISKNEDFGLVFQAEVGMRGMTEAQKQEYRLSDTPGYEPKWFQKLPEFEQALVLKFKDQIIGGTHVMACQLYQLVGLKNGFDAILAIPTDTGGVEVLGNDKHAATVVSLSSDKEEADRVSELNAEQAKELIREGANLTIGTYNTGGLTGAGHDAEIVKRVKTTADKVGAKAVGTAFNAGRVSGGANVVSGLEAMLKSVVGAMNDSLLDGDGKKQFSLIKNYLTSKHATSETTKLAEEALAKLGESLGDAAQQIFGEAIKLKIAIAKMSPTLDSLTKDENAGLSAATAVARLMFLCNEARSDEKGSKGLTKASIPNEECIRGCLSGKDRTMISAMFKKASDLAAAYVAKCKTESAPGSNKGVVHFLNELYKSGHMAQQNGSPYAGGNPPGNHDGRRNNQGASTSTFKDLFSGLVGEQNVGLTDLSKTLYKFSSYAAHSTMDVNGFSHHDKKSYDKLSDKDPSKNEGKSIPAAYKKVLPGLKNIIAATVLPVAIGAFGGLVVGAVRSSRAMADAKETAQFKIDNDVDKSLMTKLAASGLNNMLTRGVIGIVGGVVGGVVGYVGGAGVAVASFGASFVKAVKDFSMAREVSKGRKVDEKTIAASEAPTTVVEKAPAPTVVEGKAPAQSIVVVGDLSAARDAVGSEVAKYTTTTSVEVTPEAPSRADSPAAVALAGLVRRNIADLTVASDVLASAQVAIAGAGQRGVVVTEVAPVETGAQPTTVAPAIKDAVVVVSADTAPPVSDDRGRVADLSRAGTPDENSPTTGKEIARVEAMEAVLGSAETKKALASGMENDALDVIKLGAVRGAKDSLQRKGMGMDL